MQYNRKIPLVYDISVWDSYQWGAFLSGSPKTQGIVEDGDRAIFGFSTFSKEVFYRLYTSNPRTLTKVRPEAKWAVVLHEQLDKLPEWQNLQGRCKTDRYMAGVAATTILSQMKLPKPSQSLQEVQKMRDELLGLRDMRQEIEKTNNQDALARIDRMIGEMIQRGKLAVKLAQEFAEELADTVLLKKCCEAALKDVEQSQESMMCFGFQGGGFYDESVGRENVSMQEKLALGRRLGNSSKLKKIANQAGRLKRLRDAMSGSKRKSDDPSKQEVPKFTLGNKLDKVSLNELIYLADDDLFYLFAQRLTEGRLLQCEWESREMMSDGPVIVCIDTSSSMEGENEVWAKSVALNLAMIANMNKRDFMIIHFATSVVRTDIFPAQGMNADFRNKLLSSMGYFSGGGTKFEPPLKQAVEYIRNAPAFKKADIILITDGEPNSMSKEFIEQLNQEKQELRFSIYGIAIEVFSPKVMHLLSDKLINLNDLTEDLEAVTMLASM